MKTIIGHSKAVETIIRRFPVKRAMFLQGNTGSGKTFTARKSAALVGGAELSIIETGAKLLDIETIRRWADAVYTASMFGTSVVIVNEAQDLSADQMTLLLTVLDRNANGGKWYFIFTAMAEDGDITGKKVANWRPLKDRCFTPDFRIDMNEVNQFLSQWGLTADSFPDCYEGSGYSIRRLFEQMEDIGLDPHHPPTATDTKQISVKQTVIERIRQALYNGELSAAEIAERTGLTSKQVFGTLSAAVRNNRGFVKVESGIYRLV
ncbi:hypothetical protein FACS189419_04760 [Planctomycetales bacterium]|nr:hypothetical protein FACS189419_04760 [Planctomycetales bacterium]